MVLAIEWMLVPYSIQKKKKNRTKIQGSPFCMCLQF